MTTAKRNTKNRKTRIPQNSYRSVWNPTLARVLNYIKSWVTVWKQSRSSHIDFSLSKFMINYASATYCLLLASWTNCHRFETVPITFYSLIAINPLKFILVTGTGIGWYNLPINLERKRAKTTMKQTQHAKTSRTDFRKYITARWKMKEPLSHEGPKSKHLQNSFSCGFTYVAAVAFALLRQMEEGAMSSIRPSIVSRQPIVLLRSPKKISSQGHDLQLGNHQSKEMGCSWKMSLRE